MPHRLAYTNCAKSDILNVQRIGQLDFEPNYSMLSPWRGGERICPYAGVRVPQQIDCFAIAIRALFCCVFALEFRFNLQFDLEPDYIIRKPRLCRIQRYILRREILSTFHTRVDNRSIRDFCTVFTPKLPLPLRQSPPKFNTPIPSSIPLTTPNGIRIQSAVLPQLTCADRHGWTTFQSHERSALLW